jgi:electron transfer flavoprotein alpha subunit
VSIVLVFVRPGARGLDDVSAQALTLARGLVPDGRLEAVAVGDGAEALAAALGEHGVATLHVADVPGSFAPAAWAAAIVELVGSRRPAAVVAAGDEPGNEVMAHVAARLDLPFAANCVSANAGESFAVTRVRWGGSLLEEARLHGETTLLTVQPHALAAETEPRAEPAVERFAPSLSDQDLAVRVSGRIEAAAGGISLADAKVVVSGGRGVGSTEGFAVVEELAALLGAAVGCSRVVTSAGWRPHTDQVGQTGTKISPDLYIPCGISGATQHIAGCRGAKKILAVNADPEAPIFASADYAVIGDLHEILPAISAEIRKARGA